MKKLLLTLVIFFLTVNASFAYNVNKMSDDAKLVSAMKVLEANGQTDVLNRLDASKTQVIFYDLTLMSFSYAKHYAVASTDENGDNYILINSNLKNSPKEALACLIAHESVHQLAQATMEEEVQATMTEARTWNLVKNNTNTTNDRLVNRLNNLSTMYNQSTPDKNLIADSIANNSFYQSQLAKN